MIFLISQLQRFSRALRIWTILLSLLFYLWFDSKKWTYLKGFNARRREKRNTLRAKWLTKEFVNLGSASSEDVIYLIKLIKKKVLEKFKISLELEIKLIGFRESLIKDIFHV